MPSSIMDWKRIGTYTESNDDGEQLLVTIWKQDTSGGYRVKETRQPLINQLNLFDA